MHFVSLTKIVILIFCLLEVLFDELTTLKSIAEAQELDDHVAEVNQQQF